MLTRVFRLQIFNAQTLGVKFASCACAVGSGLPVGPEGPMIHIGAMLGAMQMRCMLHVNRHRCLQALQTGRQARTSLTNPGHCLPALGIRYSDGAIAKVATVCSTDYAWRLDVDVFVQGGYPLGDKAAMVADVYLRTVATMDKLRETLRDEHSFLIQVGPVSTLTFYLWSAIANAVRMPPFSHQHPSPSCRSLEGVASTPVVGACSVFLTVEGRVAAHASRPNNRDNASWPQSSWRAPWS